MKRRCGGIRSGPILWGAMCLLLATAGAHADKVVLGRMEIPNVRITGITNGEVSYISAGVPRTAALDRVSRIEFSSYPGYDDAVERIDTRPEDAARDLRQIVSSIGEDYIQRLARLRLSEALDKAGRTADAISAWAQAVAGDSSDYFVSRIPSNLPDASDARQAAADAARSALGQVRSTKVRQALQQLIGKLTAAGPSAGNRDASAAASSAAGPADQPARRTAPPAPEPSVDLQSDNGSRAASIMRSIQTYIDSGKYERALERIAQVRAQADAELQPVLEYQHAAVDTARDRPMDAAVRFLRVGLLHADHQLAPAALMKAAAALENAERPDAAMTVWRQAAEATDDPARRRQIQSRINDLEAG